MISLTIPGYPTAFAMQPSPSRKGALPPDLKSISIKTVEEKTTIVFRSSSESRVYTVKPDELKTDSFKVKFLDKEVHRRIFITDLKPAIDFSAVKEPINPQPQKIKVVPPSFVPDEDGSGSLWLGPAGAAVLSLIAAGAGWTVIIDSTIKRQFNYFPNKASTYDKIWLVAGFIFANLITGLVIYALFDWVKSEEREKKVKTDDEAVYQHKLAEYPTLKADYDRDMQEKQIERANRLITLVVFGLQNPGARDQVLEMPVEVPLVLQKPE